MINRKGPFQSILTLLMGILLLGQMASAAQVSGELKVWHKVTLTFDGPSTSESSTPNPFLDYRLEVTFTGPSSQVYKVPGYYAADGNAANTSATSGNKWRVHLAPDEAGAWAYSVSFRTGTDIAVSDAAGSSAGFMDGETDTFVIGPTDKTGRDMRAKGRLNYVGGHFLQFAGNGEYFFKQGADAPENFLAYADFDGPFKTDGIEDHRIKTWSAHVGDWQPGDPTWSSLDGASGTYGKAIIGAINYLASEGLNAFSFLPMNINGDDKNVFPYLNYSERYRMDCSRLDQWEIVFEHGDQMGMFLHFKTQETENETLLDGGNLGTQRKLYYRELIARFSHHLAMNWNLGEEINDASTAQKVSWAQYFYDNDPYHHHIVIHNGDNHYDLLGSASKLTGFSKQTSNSDFSGVFGGVKDYIDRSRNAGKKWAVACDEPGDAQHALRPDWDAGNSHEDGRKNGIWGSFMAGGYGCEWYFGYSHDHSDLTCQDWRSRNAFWDYCRYALQFFSACDHPLRKPVPAQNMINEDWRIVSGSGHWCLAGADDDSKMCIVVYMKNAGSTTVDVPAAALYQVGWMNAKTGAWQYQADIINHTGGNISFTCPFADDSALLLYDWETIPDNDPPEPDPAEWDVEPYAVDEHTISMTAVEGSDAISPPVQYYFAETSGHCNGFDSGWQLSRTYELTGLAPGIRYCFTVKMRDARGNETGISVERCATTQGTPDTDPPNPNPAAFAISPHGISQTEISMTAVTGSEAHGPVEYYFAETSGHAGGNDSGWQISQEYTDTGLERNTIYSYTVKMRDAVCNQTAASAEAIACTRPDIDIFEDDVVDMQDLRKLVSRWLDDNCCLNAYCDGCDLDASGSVEIGDFGILAKNWLQELGPSIITLEYSPIDDAYKQDTSYYNTAQLRVEYNYRISYLKFNIADIPDGYDVTNVVLQLTENGDTSVNAPLRFYKGSHNNWTETSINASNEPAATSEVGSFSGAISGGQIINVDVRPLVTGNGIVSMVIMMDAGGNDVWFGSKEAGGKEPKLTIAAKRDSGTSTQTPYNGTPATLPGTVEAEEFDLGGEGFAYHDNVPGNIGGAFRPSEDVDIQPTSDTDGNFNVGWMENGEWMEYTVNVTTGSYDLGVRVASILADAGNLRLTLDAAVIGVYDIPNTGDWQVYHTLVIDHVVFTGGTNQILRAEVIGGGGFLHNLNWIKVADEIIPTDGGAEPD